jgi:uncharacterized protein
MKTLTKIAAGACALALSLPCWADSASRESVERLFSLMNMKQLMDASYAQLVPMIEQQMGAKVPPQKREVFRRFLVRMQGVIQDEMGWDQLKGPIVEAYAQVYSQEEISQLVAFYDSPVGRKMIAKTPELMQVSQQIVAERMKVVMPRIEALGKELEQELKGPEAARPVLGT